MAIRRKVSCINKTNRSSAYERITNIGGTHNNARWKEAQESAISQIEAKTHEYYTDHKGETAEVTVASRDGRKYLKTKNDGEQPDNLLSLPECP